MSYSNPVTDALSNIELNIPAPSAAENPAAAPAAEVDEAMRREAHAMAEAQRKAEWEEKQQEKRSRENAIVQKVAAMPDRQVSDYAVKRAAADTEKLTRRNMKEMVCEHIQKMCNSRPAFARRVAHPRKSMIRCFKYITRKAREYAEQEMKDQGIERTGVYGCDVPDGLCYQWAVDYFDDPDAPEDKEDEEKFVPKPYVSSSAKSKSKAQPKKQTQKKADDMGQLSLLEVV